MKTAFISTSLTLLIISLALNIGFATDHVRIGKPDVGYTDTHRALMSALVEDLE